MTTITHRRRYRVRPVHDDRRNDLEALRFGCGFAYDAAMRAAMLEALRRARR